MRPASSLDTHPLIRFLRRHLTRRVYVFIACLLISSFIWLLMALSENYTTHLKIPVKYKGEPKNRIITGDLPPYLKIKATGYGFTLLSYRFTGVSQKPVIHIEDMAIKEKEGKEYAYLPGKKVLQELSSELNKDLRIEQIFPDTLFVEIDEKAQKLVRVKTRIETSFAPQYHRSGEIEVRPTAVRVTGPAGILDTLNALKTRPITFEDLKETRSAATTVQIPPELKNATINPKKVLVSVPVDEFTEGVITIPIQTTDPPEGWTIKIFPDSVKVHYTVALSDYDRVRGNMFRATVRLKPPPLLEKISHLKVNLEDKPAFVRNVWYEPQNVEFLMRKR